MFDMTQPIGMEVIIGSIVFILGLVGVALGIVAYYKKKLKINLIDTQVKEYDDINSFILALEKYINSNESLDNVENIFKNLEDKYQFIHFNHYLADEDIRNEDNEYEKMQNTELQKFIEALKNKSWDTAENITFLSN